MTAAPALLTTPTLAERFRHEVASSPAGRADLVALAERSRSDPALRTTLDAPLLLRPMFLTEAEKAAVQHDLAGLQQLLLSLPDRLYGGDVADMCEHLGFSPTQTMAVEETWTDHDVLLSRTDLLLDENGPRVIELNLHSSLGGIDSGPWHHAFLDLPSFASFADRHQLSFVDPINGVAGTLRAAARRRGLGSFPSLALVDWPTSYPHQRDRLDRLSRLFQRRGFDAFHCDASRLSFNNGRLCAQGRRVDLLYRVFVIADVQQDPMLLLPILAAHRAGAVVLAMSFVAELVGNKGCLAMLSDPPDQGLFTQDERDLIARTVPTTRWIGREGGPLRRATPEQLTDRDSLILKPAGGYGAHGVVPGWRTEPVAWRAAVNRASEQPYVVQQRVVPSPETVPSPDGGEQVVDTNWGVFLAGTAFNGAMIRAVPSIGHDVITTSTGAAIGACFVQHRDRNRACEATSATTPTTPATPATPNIPTIPTTLDKHEEQT